MSVLLTAALSAAASAALAGCAGGDRTPASSAVALVPGVHVVLQGHMCNRGANVFCARELVVAGAAYGSSDALLVAERRLLHERGWRRMNAGTGTEYGLDSPGDRYRVYVATAWADLSAVDFGWVKRTHDVALALSRALVTRAPTLSILLQYGAGSSSS